MWLYIDLVMFSVGNSLEALGDRLGGESSVWIGGGEMAAAEVTDQIIESSQAPSLRSSRIFGFSANRAWPRLGQRHEKALPGRGRTSARARGMASWFGRFWVRVSVP